MRKVKQIEVLDPIRKRAASFDTPQTPAVKFQAGRGSSKRWTLNHAVRAEVSAADAPIMTPMTKIEVCQGNDCYGSGGGAVLLELEELVSEYEYQQHQQQRPSNPDTKPEFSVLRGGCRNFCSMGPNVHVHVHQPSCTASASSSSSHHHEHFSQTAGIAECHTLSETVGLLPNEPTKTKSGGALQNMLLKRAHRLRWELLRDIARFREKKRKEKRTTTANHSKERLSEQLEEAYRAAMSSALSTSSNEKDGQAKDRMERRFSRLRQKLAELAASDEDSSASSSLKSDSDDGSSLAG